jgi:transcriptional regulator GlxA family with amidase domain
MGHFTAGGGRFRSYEQKLFQRIVQKANRMEFYRLYYPLRIHYAKHLLETTGLKVVDVGAKSGFNSPKYFLKLFKRLEDCTPAEYRERFAGRKEDSFG